MTWFQFFAGLTVWVVVAALVFGYVDRAYNQDGEDGWDPISVIAISLWPITLVVAPIALATLGLFLLGRKIWVKQHIARLTEEELKKDQGGEPNVFTGTTFYGHAYVSLAYGGSQLQTIAVPAGQSYVFNPPSPVTVDKIDVSFV